VGVSESAKNLVCSLLVLDPKKRPTASEALKHPWLRNSASPFPLKPKSVIYDSLKEFSSFSELKKVVIDMIAFSMSTKDLEDSTLWFRVIDKDNSGSISLQEFRQALKGKGINEDMISNVFEKIDQDHNGTITFSEFLAATLDKTKYLEDCRLTAVFKKLDTDHDGKISLSDLTDALGEWYSVSEIEKMIHDVQSKSGGDSSSSTVNFHQFVEAMYDGTGDYMRPYKTRALSMCVPTTT
jgi:calcium-dependent protein kinase